MTKRILCMLICCILLIPSTVAFADDTTTEITLSCTDDRMFGIFEADETVSYTATWTNSSLLKKLSVEVLDYFGKSVYTSSDYVDKSTTTKTITPTGLTLGHYRITVTYDDVSATKSFSVVPNLEDRRDSSDSFFAFNTLISHSSGQSTNDRKNIADYVKTIQLAGVPAVREMMCGTDVMRNPETNPEIDTTSATSSWLHYDEIMDEYKKAGIKVELMFHSMCGLKNYTTGEYYYTPGFPNEWTDRDNHFIPETLQNVYTFTNKLVEKYPNIEILEIYNEPDLTSTHAKADDGADLFAAFTKAGAIGAYDANPNVKISVSGFAGKKPYISQVYRNEIDDYVDILSYHVYKSWQTSHKDSVLDYPLSAKDWINLSKNFNMGDKQIHVNETGLRVPTKQNNDGDDEMTFEQQKAQARFNTTSAIKGIANGEDRHYMFKHGYFFEADTNNFGTLTKDNQPYMVYSAVSALTNSIGNGKYLGSMNSMPTNSEGYVFKDGTDTVLCLWSKTDNTSVSIGVDKQATLIDIMGNESTISPTNGNLNLTIGQDIVYVRFTGDADASLYTPSGFAKKEEITHNIGEEQRIVLNQRFEKSADENVINTGYYKLSSSEDNKVELDVFNFNNEEKTVRIKAKTSGEWGISTEDDVTAVTVPAMGKTTLTFNVKRNPSKDVTLTQPLIFTGYLNGNATSRSYSYIGGDEKPTGYIKLKGMNDANAWDATANKYYGKNMTCNITNTDDTVSFNYTFADWSDFWCSPYIDVSEMTEFADANGVIFDVRAVLTDGALPSGVTTVPARVYILENSGERFYAALNVKVTEDSDGEYTQVFYRDEDIAWEVVQTDGTNPSGVNGKLDWDDIKAIRFGTNITMKENFSLGMRLDLKDFGLLTEEKSTDMSSAIKSAEIVGGNLTVHFGNTSLNVKDNKVYADIGSNTYAGTYNSADNTITVNVGEQSKITDIELYYTDSDGQLVSMNISDIEIADNKITLIYSSGTLDLKNTTLFAYDVSDVRGATASTEFENAEDTPILALDEANTDGKLSFDIKANYKGKFVVKIRRNGEDLIKFLLETDKDSSGNYICKVLSVSTDASSASIDSDSDRDVCVVFAAYNDDNELIDCVVNNCSLSEGTQNVSSQRALNLTSDSTVSVFVWKTDGITPLAEKFSK